jgi:hypothetical protein
VTIQSRAGIARWKIIVPAVVAVLVVLWVVGTLIGPPEPDTAVAGRANVTEPPSMSPTTTWPTWPVPVESGGLPPWPDGASRIAYIARLEGIDPDIIHGDEDKAINRGRDLCAGVRGQPDRARLIEAANRRFTSPKHPDGFGPATAARILDAVRMYICPGW